MAIADYPKFKLTDTMSGQVGKLNEFVYAVDSNNTALLSRDDVSSLWYPAYQAWVYPNSFYTTITGQGQFDTTLNFNINAKAETNITAEQSANLTGKNINITASGNESGNGRMTLKSGPDDVLVLNGINASGGTYTDATFSGTITMPSNVVNTTAKDVAGAINELRAALITLNGGTFPSSE